MINIMDKKYKASFKVVGVFAFIVMALIFGEIRYYQGMQMQCYLDGGFLMQNKEGTPYCETQENLIKDGWTVRSETVIVKMPDLTHEEIENQKEIDELLKDLNLTFD